MIIEADDFLHLHGRVLSEDGTPRLCDAFVRHLDSACARTRTGASSARLSLNVALTKLAADEPELADHVERYVVQRQTIRAIAAELGVSIGTAHGRVKRGIDLLADWTGMAPDVVPLHLRACVH